MRTNNLRPEFLGPAQARMAEGFWTRWLFYLELFLKIPWGAAMGVTKEAGSYHPAVRAQNLAVSAAGPNASKLLALATSPPVSPSWPSAAWGISNPW